MEQIDAYLERIGLERPPRADLAALRAIHRAHLLAIPYEDLDVQLGRPVNIDAESIFEKMVVGRRGGWCYEMNGLLGWALDQLGFSVTRGAAGVMREMSGEAVVGNHLVLKVETEEGIYLADVGFGDGPIEPIRLEAGAFTSHGFSYSLTALDERWWRLKNDPRGAAPSFDFTLDAADENLLRGKCAELQGAPDSFFVQNVFVFKHFPLGIASLRGRVLRVHGPAGTRERILGDAGEFVETLDRVFALKLPEAATLWPKICARHEAVLAEQAAPSARPPA